MAADLTLKKRALQALLARTRAELAVLVEAQRRTQEGATHEESKPENDKDTRAVESSYLARGQAMRVLELENAVNTLGAFVPREFQADTPITVGALVLVSAESGSSYYFLVPASGGGELEVDGTRMKPVTLQTPFGKALLGKQVGEDFELRTPGGLKELCVEEVS